MQEADIVMMHVMPALILRYAGEGDKSLCYNNINSETPDGEREAVQCRHHHLPGVDVAEHEAEVGRNEDDGVHVVTRGYDGERELKLVGQAVCETNEQV